MCHEGVIISVRYAFCCAHDHHHVVMDILRTSGKRLVWDSHACLCKHVLALIPLKGCPTPPPSNELVLLRQAWPRSVHASLKQTVVALVARALR